MSLRLLALFSLVAALLSGCGYNTFQSLDEQSKAAWSEVLNQYQRRADLVPNLVATVKGEANFEQETLTKVVEARAKATSIQATPELINDPAAFKRFQDAQGELSGALSRLLVVTENYPNLKANQGLRLIFGTDNDTKPLTISQNLTLINAGDRSLIPEGQDDSMTARIRQWTLRMVVMGAGTAVRGRDGTRDRTGSGSHPLRRDPGRRGPLRRRRGPRRCRRAARRRKTSRASH